MTGFSAPISADHLNGAKFNSKAVDTQALQFYQL
jgi:hypothetical protein